MLNINKDLSTQDICFKVCKVDSSLATLAEFIKEQVVFDEQMKKRHTRVIFKEKNFTDERNMDYYFEFLKFDDCSRPKKEYSAFETSLRNDMINATTRI